MTFYEKHYEQCENYIYAVQHPTEFGKEELAEIVKKQRIEEGKFMVSMMGRQNITYVKLCERKRMESYLKKQNGATFS